MGVVSLGPFDLAAPIGRGGMGEVWSGIHRAQQVPVVVKVLTTDTARDPRFRQSFRHEVRAVAALDHPGIIVVYDHGVIPPEAESASEGKLPAGSPYLVMEHATAGTLHASCGQLDWVSLRLLLQSLLDALAHAHARGVIHRDLKPGNVLMGGLRPGPRITDFGIAHAAGREAYREGGGAGTPAYMAPEQFDGSSRDHGPWTDLYAFGCLAWTLVTRSPPFGRLPLPKMRAAHRGQIPPPLDPPIPVASGFEDWLLTLLEKNPAQRFQRAADAAWALQQLPNPPRSDANEVDDDGVTAPEIRGIREAAQESTWTWTAGDVGSDDPNPEAVTPRDSAGYVLLPSPPPPPLDWRRSHRFVASTLPGAGLGLHGLRTVPMVGREAERDALWAIMREVHDTGRAAAVLLAGAAGVGKSRLAWWLAERAHEVGAAECLRASNAPVRGPDEGLGAMLHRHLALGGLRAGAALQRIETLLRRHGVNDPDEAAALHSFTDPTTRGDAETSDGRVRFATTIEQHALVRRYLERLAVDRPVVLVLDDAHWGGDSIAFTRHLLEAQEESPSRILVLLTASTEELAQRPSEAAALQQLVDAHGARRFDLAPLDEDSRADLVRQLIGLEGVLAAQLEERSGGNPLFLVQLVGDWIHRRLLVPGERGFRLLPGSEVYLPDDVHEVWAGRVARALEGRPDAEGIALELAAVLGREVNGAEWRAVCTEAGVPVPVDLIESLISQRLVAPVANGPDAGWSFVHNMLRETIERRARERNRLAAHHLDCAHALRRRRRTPGLAERLGRHHASAGAPEAALEPLLAGARERLDLGEHAAAELLLQEREQLFDRLGISGQDERRVDGWVVRALACARAGELDEAEQWARAAADQTTSITTRARSLLVLAQVATGRGAMEAADALLADAEPLVERTTDRALQSWCRENLASLRLARGQFDAARHHYEEGLANAQAAPDTLVAARCQRGLARLALRTGNLEAAASHVTAARALYTKVGARDGVAACAHDRAEIDRRAGSLAEAEAGCRDATARYTALGSGDSVIPQVTLGLVLLDRGEWSDAEATLAEAQPILERQGRLPLVANVVIFRLPAAAAAGDWNRFDTLLARGRELLRDVTQPPDEVARYASLAADIADSAGESARARSARGLAVSHGQARKGTPRPASS